MKVFTLIFIALTSASALAKHVELTCTTKFYACSSGPGCAWYYNPGQVTISVPMYLNPDGFRATYSTVYDNHVLNLVMTSNAHMPAGHVSVKASITSGNVTAEAFSSGYAEIGLHNANYGRGFSCNSIHAID